MLGLLHDRPCLGGGASNQTSVLGGECCSEQPKFADTDFRWGGAANERQTSHLFTRINEVAQMPPSGNRSIDVSDNPRERSSSSSQPRSFEHLGEPIVCAAWNRVHAHTTVCPIGGKVHELHKKIRYSESQSGRPPTPVERFMRMTFGSGTWFFLALPDNEAAMAVANRVLPSADVIVDHPSGRPWLLARIPNRQVVVHREGPNRLALVGSTAADPQHLSRVSDSLRSPRDAVGVPARFAGTYCVVGSLAGQVYAQGSAMGVHRVFHALVDGVRVICNRADVLAELGGLQIDATALALRLVRSLPHPFQEIPLWNGLRPVAPQNYITVDRDGRNWNSGMWWRRPESRLSRAEGANRLRTALEAGVAARTASGAPIACDLSGGMDSTPLCYFAAQGPSGVIARTMYNDDPGGRQDLDWAHSALPSMPGVREHVVESTEHMPDFF